MAREHAPELQPSMVFHQSDNLDFVCHAKVIGVDGLRVVDCSAKPDAVRANLQFTVYMMAERISAQMRHGGNLEAALQEARAKLAA